MASIRTRKSIQGVVLALAGAALTPVWAPAAVAVTFVGAVLTWRGQGGFNVPATRLASAFAVVLHGAALAIGSREPLLGVAAAVGFLPMAIYGEAVVRRWGYHASVLAPAAVPVALALVAAAWPFGWWGLGVVPSLAHALWFATDVIGQMRRRRAAGRPEWALRVGDHVPDFKLPSRDGSKEFRLADQRGRFVVLFFVRSDWCPVCHVQIRVFQKEAQQLAERNVQLVGIGTTSGHDAVELTTLLGVDYTFLVDAGCRVAALFGAVQPNLPAGQEVPLPATFLIDPDGNLVHTSRPDDIGEFVDPGRILSVLDQAYRKRETAPPLAS